MQYSVPQFLEVEDKIIGPLSLKQFLILLGGGLVSLMWWSIFGMGAVFFLFALPTMGLFVLMAFGKFNGRPILSSLLSAMHFFSAPKLRVFSRTGEKAFSVAKAVSQKAPSQPAPEPETGSRLRRLAYILDQKTAEEERLIHSGQLKEKWLSQI